MKSLQLNHQEWAVYALSEQSLLLSLPTSLDTDIAVVQATSYVIESGSFAWLKDVVASYNSLAVFFDGSMITSEEVLKQLGRVSNMGEGNEQTNKTIRIPVCYELGMDWEDVTDITKLPKEEVIQLHTSSSYSVALIGFMPGFAYLSGMDERIACPRREFPRVRVPKGAIGIGGAYSGIYSFPCPGGWQIIGQTPVSLFDIHEMPPSSFNVGDEIAFYEISREEYDEMLEAGK